MLLAGQVAVITGSSRGIGRAVALQMAMAGARVVVNGRDHARVKEVVDEIQALGGKAVMAVESVQAMSGGERIISAAIKEFGKLDILVNNAGIIRDATFDRMTEEDWDAVMETHLKGAFACSKAAVPYMQADKQGCIINMTSLAGLRGNIGQLNYSVAKAGLLGLTWALALELARHHICVNAVAPAALTDMTQPYVEKARKKAEKLGRVLPDFWDIGSPEDVAKLVVALAAPECRTITGQVFSVNGGQIGIWRQPRHEVISSDPAPTLNDVVAKVRSIVGASQ